MHFIEINYMSCMSWLLYVVYSMAKTCLYMYKTKILSDQLYRFIVFKYVILILRTDKYILGRISLYFWGFGEKLNYFEGYEKRRQIL